MVAPTMEPINNDPTVKTKRSHPGSAAMDTAAEELVEVAPEPEDERDVEDEAVVPDPCRKMMSLDSRGQIDDTNCSGCLGGGAGYYA